MAKELTKTIWCIVKSVNVRETPDKDSGIIGYVRFGRSATTPVDGEVVNGMIQIKFIDYYNDNKKAPPKVGWATPKAFTDTVVESYAGLFFDNLTGCRLPVSMRYKGVATGCIMPGERVSMRARCGDWGLTNRGWTRFEWLTKDRSVFIDAVPDLYFSVLERAVKDYKVSVMKLKIHKYDNGEEFCQIVDMLEDSALWLLDPECGGMVDTVPSKERFNDINEELAIDNKWIKNKLRMRKEIRDKMCIEKEEKRLEKRRQQKRDYQKRKIMAKQRMIAYLLATPDNKSDSTET